MIIKELRKVAFIAVKDGYITLHTLISASCVQKLIMSGNPRDYRAVYVWVCACVCMCVREIDREIEREIER
jgi:hypothetical protein